MQQLTAQDEQMLDVFWAAPKTRPPSPAIVPTFAVTCTTTCAVCHKRVEIPVDWPGRVCGDCRADVAHQDQRCILAIAALNDQINAACAAWVDHQANQDEETGARWGRMVAERDSIDRRVARLRTGKDMPNRAALLASAVQEQIDLSAKRERAMARYPAIAQLAQREQEYQQRVAGWRAEQTRWEIARSELAATHDNAPF